MKTSRLGQSFDHIIRTGRYSLAWLPAFPRRQARGQADRARHGLPLLPALLCLLAIALLLAARVGAYVTLVDFRATPQADGSILVYWETAVELNTLFFELFRTETDTTEPWDGTPISTQPAVGDGVTGATYAYPDTDVTPGVTYYYWLQERTTDNAIGGRFGPVRTGEALATATPTETATSPTGATLTPTRTATHSANSTATVTPTPTSTRTRTATPSAIAVAGEPPTATRRFTNTPTSPPSATASPARTETLTAVPQTGTPTPLPPARVTTPTGRPLPGAPQPVASPASTVPASAPRGQLTPGSSPSPTAEMSPASKAALSRSATVTGSPSAELPIGTATASPTPAIFGPKGTGQPILKNTPTRSPADLPGQSGARQTGAIALVGGGVIVVAALAGVAGVILWRRRQRT